MVVMNKSKKIAELNKVSVLAKLSTRRKHARTTLPPRESF